MMNDQFSIINNKNVIKVYGRDHKQFLNNILTNDINDFLENQISCSALLSPQGKILFDLIIFKSRSQNDGEFIYIECSKSQIIELLKKLRLYSLRQDIYIEETKLHVVVTNNLTKYKFTKSDRRFKNHNLGRIYPTDEELSNLLDKEHFSNTNWYNELKIIKCIPEGDDDIPMNKIFPFEINYFYDLGINFNKGCFIGQEVVARVKYKGKINKQYHSFKIENKEYLELKGKRILQKDIEIGLVINSFFLNESILGFCILKQKLITNDKKYIKDSENNLTINIIL